MKRLEILNSYRSNDMGIIIQPGKFEIAPLYMVHFWDQWMNGFAEDFDINGEQLTKCEVTDEDRQEFPELGDQKEIWFYETEQGFIQECVAPSAEELEGNNICEGEAW